MMPTESENRGAGRLEGSAGGSPRVVGVRGIIGLEVHVQLMSRTKAFAGSPNPAHREFQDAEANTLLDPLVLAMPGTLPRVNGEAMALAVRVGLALGCTIPEVTRWDRKGYLYPDLPKGYQITQQAEPIVGAGVTMWPIGEDGAIREIRIHHAHLEEDAGKLLHEVPGAGDETSAVDLNRAGAPLLEIVTEPDFETPGEVGAFARLLRDVCRAVGATQGVMQRGHIRFEPNVNCELTLEDGSRVRTPISEVKNLNSFRSIEGAIAYELRVQPERWAEDGQTAELGTKSTMGWDDAKGRTVVLRQKGDEQDYGYFPEPDLPSVALDRGWVDAMQAGLPELPHDRVARYREAFNLSAKGARALVQGAEEVALFEGALSRLVERGIEHGRGGEGLAKVMLQAGRKIAKDRGAAGGVLSDLAIEVDALAEVAAMRIGGELSASAVEAVLIAAIDGEGDLRGFAASRGLLVGADAGELEGWCGAVIADPAHAVVVADVRGGKAVAVGRLVGAVKQVSGGKADPGAARAKLLEMIGSG